MRHGKKTNHLGRTSSHRNAMLANMAASLIKVKRINTTLAKAKELRKYIEPLLTRSKEDSTHSRRIVFAYLKDKEAVTELFRDVAVKIAQRPGGYTRILKTGNRLGDNAEMCMMELVDYNEVMLAEKQTTKTKTTRRSRTSASKKSANTTETVATEDTKKTPKVKKEVVETVEEVKDEVATPDVAENNEDAPKEETKE